MAHTPDNHTIETYRQQMLEMYQKATPSLSSVTAEDNWLDSRYPVPDVERDKEAIASLAPQPEPTPEPQPTPPATADFVGYLRVFAFTAGGAEPLPDARVIITRLDGDSPTVFANLTTDTDGFTPVIPLPSVDPALTLRPGVEQPYVAYTVRVTADGFQPVEHRNIPVYGNNYVTQPVAMLPLLSNEEMDTQEFTSGAPTNL